MFCLLRLRRGLEIRKLTGRAAISLQILKPMDPLELPEAQVSLKRLRVYAKPKGPPPKLVLPLVSLSSNPTKGRNVSQEPFSQLPAPSRTRGGRSSPACESPC